MKPNSLTIIIAGLLLTLAQAQRVPIPDDEHGWYKNNNANKQKVFSQVFNAESLVLDTDRDYVDVILRRASALLNEMRRMENAPDLAWEQDEFDRLLRQAEGTGINSFAREGIYDGLLALRTIIAFKNPLLAFNDILFVEHDIATDGTHGTGSHMCDQYHGFNAEKGGGLFILYDAFSDSPQLVNVAEGSTVQNGRLRGRRLTDGSFLSPDLSYDGQTIVFTWCEGVSRVKQSGKYQVWNEDTCYHIFKANIDGTGLTQLTDGPWEDFDPVWLPNGRIAFISTRRGGYGRCHGRPVPTYTLHSMKADGTDIITLSYHETNEWHPSVDDNTGMLVYTRWDYLDRDADIAHHLWTCFPDGRDPRSRHGNYPLPFTRLSGTGYPDARSDGRKKRPWTEHNCRAVPGSQRYTATAAPHHGQAFGSLVLIDPRLEDDNAMSQMWRITPDYPFPESEQGTPTRQDHFYGTAYPLSEDFYLCAYKKSLILLDAFGNRETLHTSQTGQRPIDPIPVRPRTAPTVPTFTAQGENAGGRNAVISVMSVYESDMPLPEGTVIKEMRIVQIFPKSTPRKNVPRSGYGSESLCRMSLGTVPVEADGSVYCMAPVEKQIYFQLLDENGLAVHSMRSGTYVHPGEHLSCIGCHEDKRKQPHLAGPPLALQRPPSEITPETGIVEPMNFHRLIKPIFEATCAGCHRSRGAGPDMSYNSLENYAWYLTGDNGDLWKKTTGGSRSIPGFCGARITKLLTGNENPTPLGRTRGDTPATKSNSFLEASHYGVSLTTTEKRRITMWLDLNSNELGALHDTSAQGRGELVWPVLDVDPDNPQGIENKQ